MERKNAWKTYNAEQLDELHYFCEGYKAYISDNKTERECCDAAVEMAREGGYVELGEAIAAGKQLKAGDKVGIVEGVSTTFNAQQRTAGFQDAMKAAGATVVGVQSGQWEMEKGNTVANAMLREYPDLKALLCGNDNMALGAVAAVKTAGKTGKVQVVGYDNINAVKPLLKDGRLLATADQYAAKQAVFGIETALEALKAKKTQKDMPGVIETQVDLVTK